jgi:hypothetical protein
MTRDMTERQFREAIKRNGFKPVLGGMWFEDTTGQARGVSFGGTFHLKTFKLAPIRGKSRTTVTSSGMQPR